MPYKDPANRSRVANESHKRARERDPEGERAKQREQKRAWLASLTPDQREARRQKQREYMAAYYERQRQEADRG